MRPRSLEQIAGDVLKCALAWERNARLLGNVTAEEVARLAVSQITACSLAHDAVTDAAPLHCGKPARPGQVTASTWTCVVCGAVFRPRQARPAPDDPLITVCDGCLRASCWQGTFPCEAAETAGTAEVRRSRLKALSLEHPDNWGAPDDKETP